MQSWNDLLKEIENLQMFALCKDFDELTLEDNTGGSSAVASGYAETDESANSDALSNPVLPDEYHSVYALSSDLEME